MFALARVYYVASILPIRKTMVKKFEQVMGNFLWRSSGKVLRVPIGELYNGTEAGGLGLPSIQAMCNSLMLSQLLRLLKSGDSKTLGHVGYWIGELLSDVVVGLGGGQHAEVIPEYFEQLADLVANAFASDLITRDGWRTLTNKIIYADHANSFPVTKVERESGLDYGEVWRRLRSPVLTAGAKDVLFLLIHNKLPVKERLWIPTVIIVLVP